MAVPSSGELSLLGIKREMNGNNYNASKSYTNISLTNQSTGLSAGVETINTTAPIGGGGTATFRGGESRVSGACGGGGTATSCHPPSSQNTVVNGLYTSL